MKERPIIFSGPMVRAILDSRKTQTRRPIKPNRYGLVRVPATPGSIKLHDRGLAWNPYAGSPDTPWIEGKDGVACPYGKVGDTLWVRETFTNRKVDGDYPEVVYRADNAARPCNATGNNIASGSDVFYLASDWEPERWRPSIYMPRWASRITLEVTRVRVERVQAISCADAIAEGIRPTANSLTIDGDTPDPRHEFADLWDSINAKRGYTWSSNPWVWVVDFVRRSNWTEHRNSTPGCWGFESPLSH